LTAGIVRKHWRKTQKLLIQIALFVGKTLSKHDEKPSTCRKGQGNKCRKNQEKKRAFFW
jgi:hypothetical protein